MSLFLLALLVVIAGVVLSLQRRYDIGKWRESQPAGVDLQVTGAAGNGVAGIKPLSAEERYDATHLSDKINGKADLYLTAGFKLLESRRFGLASDAGRWMERYVYHMEGYRSAYAVFSQQRRPDVEPLDLGAHAYAAANGVFLVQGPYYLEIVAAEVSDHMRALAVELARSFIAAHSVAVEPLNELAFFPEKHQVPNSTILNAGSTFGQEGLDWIFTCRYAAEGHEATAFISRRASTIEAGDLASAFMAYWGDYGGEAVVLSKEWADYPTMTILDNYEIVRVQGTFLLGVHEATDLEFGLELARQLYGNVEEDRHGP